MSAVAANDPSDDDVLRDRATGVLQDPVAAAAVTVELPDSQAAAGGPPVRVDPNMVDPATAEAMRPREQSS